MGRYLSDILPAACVMTLLIIMAWLFTYGIYSSNVASYNSQLVTCMNKYSFDTCHKALN